MVETSISDHLKTEQLKVCYPDSHCIFKRTFVLSTFCSKLQEKQETATMLCSKNRNKPMKKWAQQAQCVIGLISVSMVDEKVPKSEEKY